MHLGKNTQLRLGMIRMNCLKMELNHIEKTVRPPLWMKSK